MNRDQVMSLLRKRIAQAGSQAKFCELHGVSTGQLNDVLQGRRPMPKKSAAWSAESAAWSAESAAWSAESAAEYSKMKNHLLKLLQQEKPQTKLLQLLRAAK